MRLRPAASRVLGKLGLGRSLERAAAKCWTLTPEVEVFVPTARMDASDIARVTAAPNGCTVEHNIGLARGGPVVHEASRAFELRDAIVASGHVFARDFFMPLGRTPVPWIAKAQQRHLDAALLTTTPYGAMYFGHWVVECVPLALLAGQLDEPAVSTLADPSRSQREILRMLALDETIVGDASFGRLVVVDNVAQNDLKLAHYHAMRERARTALRAEHRPTRGVFLLRGTSGERRVLVNEAQLAEIAARKGVDVIRPQDVSTRWLLEPCFDTPLLIGVEGSQLMNGFPWLAPGGTMLSLMPPQRFDLVLKGPCDALEVTFSVLVGDARGHTDFEVDPAAFERRLDEHLYRGRGPSPRFDAVASTVEAPALPHPIH